MNIGFKRLYEEIKTIGVLKEMEGLKLKSFSPLLQATLLYPLLYFENDKTEEPNLFDINVLKKIYKIYREAKDKQLFRKILIGKDIKEAFELLKKEFNIYDEGAFKTKILENEIHFTIVKVHMGPHLYLKMKNNLNVTLINLTEINRNGVRFDSSQISPKTKPNLNIYEYVGLYGLSLDLFYTLFDEYGFINHELNYLSIVDGLTNIDKDDIALNYANSNFMNSYYKKYLNTPKRYPSRELRMLSNNLFNLLRNYDINVLKDLSFDEAIKIFIK